MDQVQILQQLDANQDIVRLTPQIVGRFYGDGNRLGQRAPDAPRPPYYQPERWIGSFTPASNPPGIPSGGVSTCANIGDGALALRDLLAMPQVGARLLGEKRFEAHSGEYRVLIKLLDARCPIPFHVHADDHFVSSHPDVYPEERFGKDEAYHFLDVPKGDCPYTHVGLHPGVSAADVVAAMRRGTDHVLELTPGDIQRFGEGFIVRAGLLHRPGTALTLEIQQPSDVYTFFQTDFGGEPLPEEALYPGFDTIEAAAEGVVNWEENLRADLLESVRLKPEPVVTEDTGGQLDWVFPPEASDKFSGMRLTIETEMVFRSKMPCVLFVWKGSGAMDERAIDGGGGPVGNADEFFLGQQAVERGITFKNNGDQPLVAFALFAQRL